ncbi:protein FAM3C isoform X2 [Toxotes jaculatrix]|nr:protein FAM3C isoform X2 [Toxotes jaculatrix]XP_040894896.1 protein FAM3C isoform X2 [Toxotes jaculatrix]XP_040894897.1 protein FAM3C isoform X2 [Toxotes jaculatrix]XP_040894898.1 protein FAM3C isoform X2 [Toxotes jaculatrix]
MSRRQNFRKRALLCTLVLVPVVLFITVIQQKYINPFTASSEGSDMSSQTSKTSSKPSAGSCGLQRDCPEDHFSFVILSGAANVMAPKICVKKKLVLGTVLNNAGFGINIVILSGKTGDVIKSGHFDMYGGDVKPLIEFLKSIEKGSVVLMASYDDPSTKLNEEARKLIAELGSSVVQSLGFRDNWVFVGGKGATVKSNFEKYLKNDREKNKYDNWPELIELQGCIPKYLE